jgi:hypothetical protein
MSDLTVLAWPPAVPLGTTAQTELMGGGAGIPKEKGGGDGTGPRIEPRYAADKSTDAAERFMIVRWNDDRSEAWSKEHIVSLGSIGPEPMSVHLARLGMYRSRQWELIAQSAMPLVIVFAEEEAELLGS